MMRAMEVQMAQSCRGSITIKYRNQKNYQGILNPLLDFYGLC